MKNPVRNNRGQFLIEMVLLMFLSLGLFMAATKKLRDDKAIAKMINGPWIKISGMIESGTWDAAEAARGNHPNQIKRNLSLLPEGS